MQPKQPDARLVLLRDNHSGRDEMNLAGHPFALLQSSQKCDTTSISYDWKRIINGREVTASWRVGTDAELGLPGPEEEVLYLVLLQLTREAAEAAGTPAQWPLQVKFSRGDVLGRLGWSDSASRYKTLDLAFQRLTAVSISAKYAFYDAETKAPARAVGFGILNEYSIFDEPRGRKTQGHLPLSHFEWNNILHTSFLAGNVRSLALDFAISLQHPTSRRLFRLLELLRFASKPPRPVINMGLFKLRDRLGMTAYRYPSKIAEKLKPAIAELTARGYLEGVSIEKDAAGTPMAVFRFVSALPAPQTLSAPRTLPKPGEAVETPPMGLVFAGAVRDMNSRDMNVPAVAAANAEAPAIAKLSRGERLDKALDEHFEALDERERAEIGALALSQIPGFLRDEPNTRSAQSALARCRRIEVAARYPEIESEISR